MKTKLLQRKFKAHKNCSCAMCKPWKRGWEGRRKFSEVRKFVGIQSQIDEV